MMMMIAILIKTHSSVSVAKKTKEDARHTSVLFTGTIKCQIEPSVSPKLLHRFLPNLHIFCLTYSQLHISKLKEIALVVLEIFVPEIA